MSKPIDRFRFGSPQTTGHERLTVVDTHTGDTYEATDEGNLINTETGEKMKLTLGITLFFAILGDTITNDHE